MTKTKQKHFFIFNVFEWVTTKTLSEASKVAKKLKKDYKNLEVFVIEVPLPMESTYDIENFLPVVPGIKQIELKD